MKKFKNIFKFLDNHKKENMISQNPFFNLKESKTNINNIYIKRIKNINKLEIKNPIIKIRKPEIDLIRIISMFSITLNHVLLHGNVIAKYNKYKELILLNILLFWHVCSFTLISGIIGYKTNKYSNLLYLWIWIFFYSVGIFLIAKKFRPKWVEKSSLFYQFFPVIFIKYWYFTEYFGMYFFLPIINKGISLLKQSELKMVGTSLFCIYILYNDFMTKKDPFRIRSGYSVISFLILFIVGVYFGKYRITFNGTNNKVIFCLFCIFVYFSSSLICYYFKFNNYQSKLLKKIKNLYRMRINSFPMISQSFSIILFFMQLKYNKYISKILSFIGPLTFGIYLIHENGLIRSNIIKKLFIKDSVNLSLKTVIKLTLFRTFQIFIICLIIDYFRNLLFRILRIRKFCIFVIDKIYKIFE